MARSSPQPEVTARLRLGRFGIVQLAQEIVHAGEHVGSVCVKMDRRSSRIRCRRAGRVGEGATAHHHCAVVSGGEPCSGLLRASHFVAAYLAMTVRRVQEPDVDEIVGLVHELAAYVRASEQCQLTAVQLRAALFGAQPAVFGHVAEVDGEVVGFALWFLNFSTWDGMQGIYLEDLFVRPEHRRTGLGQQLLSALAAECVRHGYSRLQWWVLDWNKPAMGFYHRLGAVPMQEGTVFRVDGPALRALADGGRPSGSATVESIR